MHDEEPGALGWNDESPYACGGGAVADSARSLAETLRAAPVEAPDAAALRHRMVEFALELAEAREHETLPVESRRNFDYHRALWKLRDIASELGSTVQNSSSGLQTVLEAFRDRFRPGMLMSFRPTGLAALVAREQVETLEERLHALDIRTPDSAGSTPSRLLVVRYTQGEQNHTLMACTALPYFHTARPGYAFAASAGGPAYFFAAAADIQNNKGFSDAFDPPRLCFIGDMLEASGWLSHPVAGPLIERWREYFGFDAAFLDRTIKSERILQDMRTAIEQQRAATPVYTPAEFDQYVPSLLKTMLEELSGGSEEWGVGSPYAAVCVVSILNAAWIFAQRNLDGLYGALGSRTAEDRWRARRLLNRWVARQIERGSASIESIAGAAPPRPETLFRPP